ncbi:MAG: Transcriptional regulator, TrmB [Parcubacteria group bacterium GW2011_GWC2_38_7]|nr:MAG: Transcriptional regulator, TrmB [Parcubacteria group bacterium GW2011_GWC2_38_7]
MEIQNEVKNKLYTSLQHLGLNEQEISLYSLSLSLGPTSITELAKHLNMARPNVYLLIKKLKEVSLVNKTNVMNKKFMVEPPTIVLEKIRERKNQLANNEMDLSSLMPNLLATYQQGSRETKIKIYKGEKQYLDLFYQTLDEANGEIKTLGSAGEFIKFISWEEEEKYIKTRIKKNIFVKALLFTDQDAETLRKNDKIEMRETRILKNVKPFDIIAMIFANKLILWQPKAPLAILIEDEYIVQMHQNVFETLWGQAKPDSSVIL